MKWSDTVTFWIIELIIIGLILFYAYRSWDICHNLPENYDYSHMLWIMRMYRFMPKMIMVSIGIGTVMNVSALYSRSLQTYKKSSRFERILIRLTAAVIGYILSLIIIALILRIFLR